MLIEADDETDEIHLPIQYKDMDGTVYDRLIVKLTDPILTESLDYVKHGNPLTTVSLRVIGHSIWLTPYLTASTPVSASGRTFAPLSSVPSTSLSRSGRRWAATR